VIILDVNLDKEPPLLGILSQFGGFNQGLGVLSAHIDSGGSIENSNFILIVLNELTNLIKLLLLHVTVEE
jgi:hypothetical protein